MTVPRFFRGPSRPIWIAMAACLLSACAEYLGTSFSEIVPPEMAGGEAVPGAHCVLEMINGTRSEKIWHASRNHRIVFYGWALNSARASAAAWLIVRLRSVAGDRKSYYAVTWARGPRDDVGRVYGPGPGIAIAAFDLTGTLQQVPPGTYDIDIVVSGQGGPESCSTERQLAVT